MRYMTLEEEKGRRRGELNTQLTQYQQRQKSLEDDMRACARMKQEISKALRYLKSVKGFIEYAASSLEENYKGDKLIEKLTSINRKRVDIEGDIAKMEEAVANAGEGYNYYMRLRNETVDNIIRINTELRTL